MYSVRQDPGAGVLAFVAAESRELVGILQCAAACNVLRWPVQFAREFVFNGQPAVGVANGPGFPLAGAALDTVRERRNIRGVVSVGYCGALRRGLERNDIVIATEINSQTVQTPFSERPFIPGAVLSDDHVVVSSGEKSRLALSGAIAAEMEAEALRQRAEAWGVPFYCIRVVTDTADEELPLDFNRLRDADGRFSRSRILLAALRRPGVLAPKLLRFDRRCRSASAALGEFIADCRF
jgi:nucleoside phosphorylase